MAGSIRIFIRDVGRVQRKFKLFRFIPLIILIFIYFSGLYQYVFTTSYELYYEHPGSSKPFSSLMSAYQKRNPFDEAPLDYFDDKYIHSPVKKCFSKESLRVAFFVMSSIDNVDRRETIRSTWGKEDRFTDIQIRTLFLLGSPKASDHRQTRKIEEEVRIYQDIIQGDFMDNYYNMTKKNSMGIDWAVKYCSNAQYFVFMNDDYYLSTKNLLRFVKNPLNYPEYLSFPVQSNGSSVDLMAGTVFDHPMPIRYLWSKWYVPLSEYPYSYYPPYVTGGIVILSNSSIQKLHVAALFTKPFRLNDIYVGILAKKAQLTLINSPHIYFDKLPYTPEGYKYVIASHGFNNPESLKVTWMEQRSYGYA